MARGEEDTKFSTAVKGFDILLVMKMSKMYNVQNIRANDLHEMHFANGLHDLFKAYLYIYVLILS